jgi:hypothetical protein
MERTSPDRGGTGEMAHATDPPDGARTAEGTMERGLIEYACQHIIHHALAAGERHRYGSIPFDFDWICCRLVFLGASHLADECRAVEGYVSGSAEVADVLTSVAALVGTSRKRLAMQLLLRIPDSPASACSPACVPQPCRRHCRRNRCVQV